jgi:hypothetical protein
MHGSGGASEKSILQADFQKKYPCYVLTPKSKAPRSSQIIQRCGPIPGAQK